MGENVYKSMKKSGSWSLVLGIVLIVFGIAAGVLTIINGAGILKAKSEVMF